MSEHTKTPPPWTLAGQQMQKEALLKSAPMADQLRYQFKRGEPIRVLCHNQHQLARWALTLRVPVQAFRTIQQADNLAGYFGPVFMLPDGNRNLHGMDSHKEQALDLIADRKQTLIRVSEKELLGQVPLGTKQSKDPLLTEALRLLRHAREKLPVDTDAQMQTQDEIERCINGLEERLAEA